MKWKPMAFISGFVWLAMGCFLLSLGIKFLQAGVKNEESMLSMAALCLFVGFLKGRFVLRKSAFRQVERLRSFEGAIPFWKIYSAPYYVLIALMMGMGLLFNFFGVSPFVRGSIDIAVGSALIQGSITYFQATFKTSAA